MSMTDTRGTDRRVHGVQSIGDGHVERVAGLALPHQPLGEQQAAVLTAQVELLPRVTVCERTQSSTVLHQQFG